MIYRVSMREKEDDEHRGYDYYANKQKAKKAVAELKRKGLFAEISGAMPVPKNKLEMLMLLDYWGGHPDNG